MGCFKSKAAEAATPSEVATTASGRAFSAGLPQPQPRQTPVSGISPKDFLTQTYPFVVHCHGIQKTLPIFKQHDGATSFKECIGTIHAAFEVEVEDLLKAEDYKFWVCGPVVQKSKLYHFVSPDSVCHRWVQEVNMQDDPGLTLAFVVARCTTQPSVTLHMRPVEQKYEPCNFEGS